MVGDLGKSLGRGGFGRFALAVTGHDAMRKSHVLTEKIKYVGYRILSDCGEEVELVKVRGTPEATSALLCLPHVLNGGSAISRGRKSIVSHFSDKLRNHAMTPFAGDGYLEIITLLHHKF